MKLQTTVFTVAIVTIFMAAVLFYINKKLKEFDPLSEPKGIVLLVIMYPRHNILVRPLFRV